MDDALLKTNQEVENILKKPESLIFYRKITLGILRKLRFKDSTEEEISSLNKFKEDVYNSLPDDLPKSEIEKPVKAHINDRFKRLWKEAVVETVNEIKGNPQRVDLIWERKNETEKIIEELTSPPYVPE